MPPKRLAAIVTEYRRLSHADVILGKILDGYNYDGKQKPDLQIVSMYVDQFPGNDMSRAQSRRHGFPIFDSIADAVTLRKNEIAVDGVVIIGEHGKYPFNERGQILYPRRRWLETVADLFAKYKKIVPVFSDKHLSAHWHDAKAVYDRVRADAIPFMAGSTIPVTWRRPPLTLPRNVEITEAIQVGYGPIENYGFHAFEGLQCMVERRRGGEVGVRSVQCLTGFDIWKAMDQKRFSQDLLEAAFERVTHHARFSYRDSGKYNDAVAYLVEYVDGLKAAVVMPNGWIFEGTAGAFTFAARLRGQQQPVATHYYLQQPDPFAHFRYLIEAIERLMHTNHPCWPLERTLLTTGMLDAAMLSKYEMDRKIPTPHLAIRYSPIDYPFATDPVPPEIKR